MKSLLFFFSFLLFACAPQVKEPRAATADALQVLTYNVNYGLAGDQETLEAVLETGASLVLLQETTPAWAYAIEGQVGEKYPFREHLVSGGAGGMTVLSEHPFTTSAIVEGHQGWFPTWILVVDAPMGEVQVIHVHLRPPVSNEGSFVSGYFQRRDVHQAEIEAALAEADLELPTLVVGDFNEDPGGAAIEHLESFGFVDALTAFHPEAITWRWIAYGIELIGNYDHILYSEDLDALDAEVLHRGNSDHLPVLVTLERRE